MDADRGPRRGNPGLPFAVVPRAGFHAEVVTQQMRYICEVSFILPESMELELRGRIRAENIVVESATRLHDDRSARRELDRFFTCQLRLDVEHAQRVVAFRSAWMVRPERKIVEYQRAAMRL